MVTGWCCLDTVGYRKLEMAAGVPALEHKGTPDGDPTIDFYWRQKSSSLNVVQ